MILEDAVLWLDRKARSLEAELDDEIGRRHTVFRQAALDALDAQWERWGVGGTWSVDDVGYGVRLADVVASLDALATPFLDGLRPLFEGYGARAWLFGYHGALWLLSGQLPATSPPLVRGYSGDEVRALASRPWQGGDLASDLATARLDFLRTARREMILSQSAKEGLPQARQRLAWAVGTETALAESGLWGLGLGGLMQVVEGRKGGGARKGIIKSRSGVLAKLRSIASKQVHHGRALGGAQAEDDNADLVKGTIWITAQDEKVCDRCAPLQGQWYPAKSYHERAPLHNFCRCYEYPLAKSFSELGVSMDVPETLPSLRPYGEWALDMGARYDGGLGGIRMRRGAGKGMAGVRLPEPGKAFVPPELPRAQMARARRAAYERARRAAVTAPRAVAPPEVSRARLAVLARARLAAYRRGKVAKT